MKEVLSPIVSFTLGISSNIARVLNWFLIAIQLQAVRLCSLWSSGTNETNHYQQCPSPKPCGTLDSTINSSDSASLEVSYERVGSGATVQDSG